MTGTLPGPDERAAAERLRALGVGLGTEPAPGPPAPAARPRDWLDDILDDNASTPTPAQPPGPVPPAPSPPPSSKHPRRTVRPRVRRSRTSLADSLTRMPTKVRWLLFHGTAAGAGWFLGFVDWGTTTAAWFAAGHWTHPSAWVLYVLGAVVVGLYRRARQRGSLLAWMAAVPLSSVVLGVLLYGTTS